MIRNNLLTAADGNRDATYSAALAACEPMRPRSAPPRAGIAAMLFAVLDPIPYGFFVAALIFDGVYARSGQVQWFKSAAWLIAIGLLFAIVPRLINLAHVWFGRDRRQGAGSGRMAGEVAAFWLNLFAIAAAVWNAFVHSRDAYGVMPEGLWLSVLTVALLVLAKVMPVAQPSNRKAAA